MGTSYRLDVYNPAGVKQFVLTDFLNIEYRLQVNTPAFLQFDMSGFHSILDSIDERWQVEVWRRPLGQDWNRELSALVLDIEWRFGTQSEVTLRCSGILSLLTERIINWPTGVANRTAFTSDPAETIMKTLVEYNAGPSALATNGRKRDGVISGLTVQADGANGNTQNWYCHGKNLLDNLQDLSLVAGGDFDLVKTSTTTYEFRWYTGQLGTDRSSTVTFGMGFGNMENPVYKEDRMDEKTVACVWGQGEGTARDYVTRTGANYSASNDVEIYIDARDIDLGDTTALNTRGDERIKEHEAEISFAFNTLETPSTLYGVDYFLGDKITAINPYNDNQLTLKISSMTVSMNERGDERIIPGFTSLL